LGRGGYDRNAVSPDDRSVPEREDDIWTSSLLKVRATTSKEWYKRLKWVGYVQVVNGMVCHCASNASSNLALTSTTTIPLTFLNIKSSERQQSRKGCESLMGWVGGVNARVCAMSLRIEHRLSPLYPGCVSCYYNCVLWMIIAVLILSGSLLLINNNSNPTKMLVEESTRASSAKIQMGRTLVVRVAYLVGCEWFLSRRIRW
jgi:hypothetical protein